MATYTRRSWKEPEIAQATARASTPLAWNQSNSASGPSGKTEAKHASHSGKHQLGF
jgi:hypothetical protein